MSHDPRRPRLPYSDYLAIDRDSLTHVELFDGEVYAMAGGTPEHALLIANVTGLVGNALLGRPCRVYAEALRVYMPQRGDAAYPDLKVICGPVETHPDDPTAATNPVVLVEVLSDGTEAFDRGGKFHRYQSLPSLRDYLLVDQHEPLLELFHRNDDGTWTYTAAGPGQVLALPGIDATLSVDEVYQGVALKPRAPRPPDR